LIKKIASAANEEEKCAYNDDMLMCSILSVGGRHLLCDLQQQQQVFLFLLFHLATGINRSGARPSPKLYCISNTKQPGAGTTGLATLVFFIYL